MWRWALLVSRPFGIALGIFVLLNLALALDEPQLSANRLWLDLRVREPWLSLIAAILGGALFVPHSWSSRGRLRTLQIGILCGFLILSLASVAGFYHRLFKGVLLSHFPVPFGALTATILMFEIGRLLSWAPLSLGLPRPARRFFGAVFVVMAFFVMLLAHIYTYGKTDFAGSRAADAIVVLGARAYPGGQLSHALKSRMDTAIAMVKNKQGRFLIVSGGVDAHDLSEAQVMKDYAVGRGVEKEQILVDEGGNNTYLSSVGCARLARLWDLKELFVVSHYFHNARVKLIFERANLRCATVPAGGDALRREPFYLLREAVAYPYYLVFRR